MWSVYILNYFSRTGSTFFLRELSKVSGIAVLPEFDFFDRVFSKHWRKETIQIQILTNAITHDEKLNKTTKHHLLEEFKDETHVTLATILERSLSVMIPLQYQTETPEVVVCKSMLWMYNPWAHKKAFAEYNMLFLRREPLGTFRSQLENTKISGLPFSKSPIDFLMRYEFYNFFSTSSAENASIYSFNSLADAPSHFCKRISTKTKTYSVGVEARLEIENNQLHLHGNVSKPFTQAINASNPPRKTFTEYKVAQLGKFLNRSKGRNCLSAVIHMCLNPRQASGHLRRLAFLIRNHV